MYGLELEIMFMASLWIVQVVATDDREATLVSSVLALLVVRRV
jgi:hypothetical protein